jgi:hypothetical protein
MNELTTIGHHLQIFVQQHVPDTWQAQGVPIAILTLIGGVALSVFGAKLARVGMTCAFVLGGAALGGFFAKDTGFTPAICVLIGAAAIGVIGHLTFRVWVGVISAAVISSLALGAFAQQRLLPHVAEFDQRYANVSTGDTFASTNSTVGFSIPSPAQQQAYAQRSPQEWAQNFWNFVSQKDQRIPTHAKLIGMVALVTGLLIGLLASRATLILSTAIVGTVLVVGSVVTLLTRSFPGSYESLMQRPGLTGVAVGGFLVTSLILQGILAHKGRAPETKSPAKS